MCLYKYLHYICDCTHRQEQKCELSISPFTDIFCPNIELQRVDSDRSCGQAYCNANLQAKFQQLQLQVRHIHGLMSKAKFDREQLRKRVIAIRQAAIARRLDYQKHPQWNWIIKTAAELERNMIQYEQAGQLSVIDMARLKGVPPTGPNIRSMLTEPNAAQIQNRGIPQLQFAAPSVPLQSSHSHPSVAGPSTFHPGARRQLDVHKAPRQFLNPGGLQRSQPFNQHLRRQHAHLRSLHGTRPRRGRPRNADLPILTKARTPSVVESGESTTPKRRSGRLSGKLVNYNQDSDEDELVEEEEEIQEEIGNKRDETPEPMSDDEDDGDFAMAA